ncbi:MAG: hypothetical protein H0W02_18795 [Ktedonobacteraceae bacterium]|nr:hypothetical protein [Ktedonobacteraceae bacterium]
MDREVIAAQRFQRKVDRLNAYRQAGNAEAFDTIWPHLRGKVEYVDGTYHVKAEHPQAQGSTDGLPDWLDAFRDG